jgi:hypothetical protein
MTEITQVKDNEYLVHFPSGHHEQYKLYGKQSSVSARIYNIRRLQDRQDFGSRCRENAAFSKEFSRSQAIKCITLFLMTNPVRYRNKTALIKALKKFADSHKIKVSEKKIAEQYPSIKGLVQ